MSKRGWSGAVVFDDHSPITGAVVFDDRLHTTDEKAELAHLRRSSRKRRRS